MRKLVQKKSEAETIQGFPIANRLNGWFFRLQEVSNGVYRAEGTDLWGRTVSQTGTDEERLIAECVESAKGIQSQLK